MGHRGARAPPLLICRGHGGAQITDMKRKWSSLEDDRPFAHSIWKHEQHLYNVIFFNSKHIRIWSGIVLVEHYVIAAEWRPSSIWLHSLIVLIMPLLVVDFAIGSMLTRNLKAMQWLRIIRRLQWNLQTTLEATAFRQRCTTACKLNKRSTARLYCSCSAHWDFLLDKDLLYEATPMLVVIAPSFSSPFWRGYNPRNFFLKLKVLVGEF